MEMLLSVHGVKVWLQLFLGIVVAGLLVVGTGEAQTPTPVPKTETTLSVPNEEVAVNNTVELSAKLEEEAFPWWDIGDKTVSLSVNGSEVCSESTDADGQIFCPYTPTATGTFTITATFGGDNTYEQSSGSGTLTVKSKKSTSLTVPTKEVGVNNTVELSAKLEEEAFPWWDIGNKTVSLSVNGSAVCSKSTDGNGQIFCHYTPAATGTFTITATFVGDGTYERSSGSGILTVKLSQTPTNLEVRNKEVIYLGSTVLLEARLTDASSSNGISSKRIDFFVDGTLVVCDDNDRTTDASGWATCRYDDVPNMAVGAFPIMAEFRGDSTHKQKSSESALKVVLCPSTSPSTEPTHVVALFTGFADAGELNGMALLCWRLLQDQTGIVVARTFSHWDTDLGRYESIEFLNRYSQGTRVLIGHSFGGDSAVEVAQKLGSKIDRLVQIDSVGIGDERKPANVITGLNYFQNSPLPIIGIGELQERYVENSRNVDVNKHIDEALTHIDIHLDSDVQEEVVKFTMDGTLPECVKQSGVYW